MSLELEEGINDGIIEEGTTILEEQCNIDLEECLTQD